MKILALTNLYPPDVIGGYEIACGHIVDFLRGRGHDVRVLSGAPRQPVATADHVWRRFQLTDVWNPYAMGFGHGTRMLREAESRYFNAHNVHVLLSALEEFQPDVLYACSLIGLGGLGLLGAIQFLDQPWVWQLGDAVPKYLCSQPNGLIPPLAKLFGDSLSGSFIVVSRRLADEIESHGIRLNGPSEIIPNWIVGSRPAPRREYFRSGRLRVLNAGQISGHKGIDCLLEAVAILKRDGVDLDLDLFGPTDPRFDSVLRKLDLNDRVRLMGIRSQSEIFAKYSEYDVFAFPTESREPFGMAPLEAAARGCVPIIARECGIAEYMVHGVHCLKADRTPASFAAALGDVARGRVGLEPIGRRGEAFAWREFHIDVVAPRIERRLLEAASRSRRPLGGFDDARRMARMAEHLTHMIVQEGLVA
ncbi:MAG: glycosyltransferase family 4 protein [Planctomycetota bacterium]|nr:glycosyltransferase family 4 protein [Planctomycetota bacterium]